MMSPSASASASTWTVSPSIAGFVRTAAQAAVIAGGAALENISALVASFVIRRVRGRSLLTPDISFVFPSSIPRPGPGP